MGKKLAIRGHATRGEEVIELLEMMGGYADELIDNGINEKYAYLIIEDENNVIDAFPIDKKDEFDFDVQIFTLEEFLEKYPYKVGDKIPDVWGDSLTVKSMSWDENYKTVMYGFKETIFVARGDEMYLTNVVNNAGLKIEKNMNTNIEFDLTKYSYEIKEGKLVVSEKTPKYPKTYEECCERVNACPTVGISYDTNEDMLYNDEVDLTLLTLRKLLICRDAYWKIAGEQMGLGKPWEPDWKNSEEKRYCIVNIEGDISLPEKTLTKWILKVTNKILVFPTEEMRDAFYENFKDLIENCKELL